MTAESHSLLAREGSIHLALSLGAAIIATWAFGLWSIPFWLLFAFIAQFFRDPRRGIPAEAGAIVSPADGKIVSLGMTTDPYLERRSLRISIFMNVFSVHSNRVPVGGVVMQTWYNPGRFFNAVLDKASLENERRAVHISGADGVDVISVQIAGLIARRILCYVKEGDRVARGQRYGFIRFGSRVDVYLPPDAVPCVRLGQWVKGGCDIIANIESAGITA